MPSVSFNSIYARNAYPSGVVPAFDRTNWTMGVSVNVPILTGGRQKGDQAVALAELEQARAQRRQIEELAALDTRSSWAELVAARAAWEATAGTVQQAQRAYQIANVRFTNGVSTQLELSDARLSLQQAEANRTQAARDLQVARARVALLPNLPVDHERRHASSCARAGASGRAAGAAAIGAAGRQPDQERVGAGQHRDRWGLQ